MAALLGIAFTIGLVIFLGAFTAAGSLGASTLGSAAVAIGVGIIIVATACLLRRAREVHHA